MSRFYDLVTEHVRTLGRGTPGKPKRYAERDGALNCIRMASNENPFGPSPLAIEAMQAVAEESNFYPDNNVAELRRKIAERHLLAIESVLVTAGSTSLLGIIARTLLSPGRNAVSSERSFIVYSIATKAAGGRLIEVPMRHDGFDLDAIADAIDQNTRIIFVANPNNPTGTIVGPDALDRFLTRIPDHVIVVLDEAYYDFAQYFAVARGVEYSRALEYVRQGRNVVVLRTFSKAHGLAGVRVGYGLGPAELIGYFRRMRTTFSVSVMAQAAASAALEDAGHIQQALENNAEQSALLSNAIFSMGYHVSTTWGNFLYCELGGDAGAIASALQVEGVIIRPLGAWGAPTAIRVTVGTPDQNQIFLKAFKKVMDGTPVR